MLKKFLLKDGLAEPALVHLCSKLNLAGACIHKDDFLQDGLSGLNDLELKERVQHIVCVLGKHLPHPFSEAAIILNKIRKYWHTSENADKQLYFSPWPVVNYVAENGIEHPKIALSLLRYLTPLFTAEFAVRAFLKRHPEQTYNEMLLWCLDTDKHVRRLASEGTRPRLPWAEKLSQFINDPMPVISLLENLRDDPSDYVRRSVANNLNDISKDHPELVVETCRRWIKDPIPARRWVIKHALRTQIKVGNRKVFPLLGYTARPKIILQDFSISAHKILLGETLVISARITSTAQKAQKLVIDYSIYFMKSNGKKSPKVFKWRDLSIRPGQSVFIEKKHTIKKITTRSYYPGTQIVKLTVNGECVSQVNFNLVI